MVRLAAALGLPGVAGAMMVRNGCARIVSTATPRRGEGLQRQNQRQQQHRRHRASPEECHYAQNISSDPKDYT